MGFYSRTCVLVSCFLLACCCMLACGDASKTEKKGRVIITDTEYSIRQTHGAHGNSYVLDARGKIRNVGDVDVKKVVVTAYCKSCTLAFTSQRWFTSDVDKTDNQLDTISYLATGAEEEFRFEEVAFYFTHEDAQPENIPEDIEIVIESFDTVE